MKKLIIFILPFFLFFNICLAAADEPIEESIYLDTVFAVGQYFYDAKRMFIYQGGELSRGGQYEATIERREYISLNLCSDP